MELIQIVYLALGALGGIIVGALPGLTATMAITLLLSVTYGMETTNAIALMIGIFVGGIYGGSFSAILLNVPGTPSSAATAIDGFPLAKKGKAPLAILVSTLGSTIGGLIGLAILVVASPLIAKAALKIAVWEYFWLAIFGIVIAANLTSESLLKGLIAGMLGLLLTTVGLDPQFGDIRLTFGIKGLYGGFSLVPALVGFFGLAEVFETLSASNTTMTIAKEQEEGSILKWIKEAVMVIKNYWQTVIISALVSTFTGALPGVGHDVGSWVSYDIAKKRAKDKELFGNGAIEGVLASEVGNNASVVGAFIPLITLGIPGCAVTTVILAALRLHGLRPGPTFFIEQKGFIYDIVIWLLLANLFIVVWGIILNKFVCNILSLPIGVIMPLVVVFSAIGSYGCNFMYFDIVIMFFFGVLGYIMRKVKIPAPPLVLGLILGNMAETSLRRALAAQNSFVPFFTRPISIILIIIIILSIIGPKMIKKILYKSNFVNSKDL